MATSSAIAAGLRGPAAPPTTVSTADRTREQILADVEKLNQEGESAVKVLKNIDTGRKKAAENRDAATKGRIQIDDLKKRIDTHLKEVKEMQEPPTTDPMHNTFYRKKADASKLLTNLTKKLDQVDKNLKKLVDTIPSTAGAATPAAPAESENSKGLGALLDRFPFGSRKKSASRESLATSSPAATTTAAAPVAEKPVEGTGQETSKKTTEEQDDEDEEGSDEEDDDDEDVVSDKKKESKPSAPVSKTTVPAAPETKKSEAASEGSEEDEDESEDEEEDDDADAKDNYDIHRALVTVVGAGEPKKETSSDGRRSQSPALPASKARSVAALAESAPLAPTTKPKKSARASPLPPSSARKKTPSPRRRPEVAAAKKQDEDSGEDSYFEESDENDDVDHELQGLRDTGDYDEPESDQEYDDGEEDGAAAVNTKVQQLRTSKYAPGSQFLVTHDIASKQTGDLTVHRGEILTLDEQRPDDWWLFKNAQNQQGAVPINAIQPLSTGQIARRRAKPNTSATVLVDAFKAANSMPAGYIASDLAPLADLEEYKLWRAIVPKMTESNLAFADLCWRPEVDKIHVHDTTFQKILTLKTCVKIPRIKGDQVRVLDRSVRVCLYDGFEIISNIHTVRAIVPKKLDERDLTEDWQFVPNDINTLIDEQNQLLIRSNTANSSQRLKLLFELSQWCQSTVTQEKCEVACGWAMVPLQDEKPPLITDTKGYNELLHGGHVDETNVLLDPQYKILRSDGLSGKIDRIKRARIKFSVESRETDLDLLYDNLPIQSIIVPLNLTKSLAYYRNELAYQLYKRQHPTGLSTTPIDSIFLSTFFQAIEQPDLIYGLRRVYRSRQRRFLSSSSSSQQQREEFIRTYELFIYPLLYYRQLPPYDFHDRAALDERRKLITDMIRRQLPNKRTPPQDILSILLDPNLTDKWTPFTTDEISFSLQKYIPNFRSDVLV
ncbi:unnamed protein product [Adineta ricciae]|uniref:SH3 domain-containing protein n=1 Tax=Adineta ricciae TaxID=249248 RepID=A0A815MAR9_ADIRI|nr:unnamed protein product [Adineta ricciae]